MELFAKFLIILHFAYPACKILTDYRQYTTPCLEIIQSIDLTFGTKA